MSRSFTPDAHTIGNNVGDPSVTTGYYIQLRYWVVFTDDVELNVA